MSFDINEAVFDSKGTYLEEQALRYEHDLMEQFAASPEGQAITQRGKPAGHWTVPSGWGVKCSSAIHPMCETAHTGG